MYVIRVVLVALFVYTCQGAEFRVTNKAGGPIWLGIQGATGHEHLENGGKVLEQNQEITITAPDNWSGRFWPRTYCDPSSQHCLTGDCGNKVECAGAGGNPPATLVEITLKGDGGKDFYDVSLVDGFNIPATIAPEGGQGDGSQYSCVKSSCDANVNDGCPGELQEKNGDQVIACKSACAAFNTDEYCCRGAHNTADTCKSSDWPQDYPKYFKDRCPDAYSYAYDDHKSTFTCIAQTYVITFG